MKTLRLLLACTACSLSALAIDTTPPTLTITHTWMEKDLLVPAKTHFKMYLDPRDETGLVPVSAQTILFRSALNTSTIPATAVWHGMPWKRGEAFDLPFTCTSCVIELMVQDAAGNQSPVQKRTFASPFPFSPPPNLSPIIAGGESITGSAMDCRGLFVGRFDGVGSGDDIVQVDRSTGVVMVRRIAPTRSDVSLQFAQNTITDSASADFDTDSRADLVVVADGHINVYHNDGLDGAGVVQFGPQTIATSNTGISTFLHVAVGDVNGDGRLDIVVSGEDVGGAARIGWLIADASFQFTSSDGVAAPAGSTAGRIALGDLSGDGRAELVMVDAPANQMIVFRNKLGVFASDSDPEEQYRPKLIATGLGYAGPNPLIPSLPAAVQALTIGDVTGDGRNDIITVMTTFGFFNPLDSNDGRTRQRWRLYENRGSDYFYPFTDQLLGQSPASQTVMEDVPCDVMLMELNNDRFPEMLFTNYYEDSVRVLRFTPLLDANNFLITLDDGTGPDELNEQNYVPALLPGEIVTTHTRPTRLAKGKYKTNAGVNSIAMSFASSNSVRWEESKYSTSIKTYEVQGGVTTDSDETGVDSGNGAFSYTAFSGEKIHYSMTFINNSGTSPSTGTATNLTGVFLDCVLPTNVSISTDTTINTDWTTVTISGVKYIRYIVDVPAGTSVTKQFDVKILSGVIGSVIAPTAYLHNGLPSIASTVMPKVTLKEPIQFRNTVESQSDNSGGDTAHAEEWIAYRTNVMNLGDLEMTSCKLTMALPANTTHMSHTEDSELGVTPSGIISGVSYPFWRPNATIAVGNQVIDSNNHLQKCTANGISGLTAPTWDSIGGNTIDGPVVWKDMGLKAITSLVWADFDLAADANKTVELKVLIKAGLADGSKITRGATTFSRTDITNKTISQTAPSFTTTLLNPLEISLSLNGGISRPGDLVHYTFNVHNWANIDLTNSKVVNAVPPGMVFFESGASDGSGNFNQFPGYKKKDLTSGTPVTLDAGNNLTWALGTIPKRSTRTIEFDLQVQNDVPDSYNFGTAHPTVDIANTSYNFVGNNTLGKRLFALTPKLGAVAGAVQTATAANLIATGTPRHTLISGDDPLDVPSLYVIKSFEGNGRQMEGGQTVDYLINEATVPGDGIGLFKFMYANNGTGDARNVIIRDYVPTGMTFLGFIRKNFITVTDFKGYHFYDAANKEIVANETYTDSNGSGFYDVAEAYVDTNKNKIHDANEAFTDSNGNGVYDAAEPYVDANNNKKFDGILPNLVRSMELVAGDLPHRTTILNFQFFDFKAQAVSNVPGTAILSYAGGMSGVKTGVNFTPVTGYHLRADNLRFPVNGSPDQVKVVITAPAKVTFPVQTVKSRSNLSGTESVEVGIPYEVTGGSGLALTEMKMEFDIPKGYRVLGAQVVDTAGAVVKNYVPGDNTNTIFVTTNAAGVKHITMPLDVPTLIAPGNTQLRGLKIGFPRVQLDVDQAAKAALLTTGGVTTKPLTYTPKITGKYIKGGAAPAAPDPYSLAAALGAPGPLAVDPPPVALSAASTFGVLPTLVDPTKDSRVFVGRSAPLAVKPGDIFTYVIFVGNLTAVPMSQGVVSMNIPEGCTGISATPYHWNGLNVNDNSEVGGVQTASTVLPKSSGSPTSDVVVWNTPLLTGTKVSWSVGSITPSEGGVVTLTVKLREDYLFDRVDDSSCVFDVINASAKTAETVGIVVRAANAVASDAQIKQRALDGLQVRSDGTVTNALSNVTIGNNSLNVRCAGADAMQLTNGVATIPLGGHRVMAVGSSATVVAPSALRLLNDATLRIAVGPGNTATGVSININVPGYFVGAIQASDLILDLKHPGANIVAAGGGNIVAAGGGNIVAAGGGNMQAASTAPAIVMPDGSPSKPVSELVTSGDVKLIGHDGSSIVAAGGGNIVAAGGGNIVAAGGGNLIGHDGSSVVSNDGAGFIGKGGAGLVGLDGASIVAGGGLNIMSFTSGNVFQANGVVQGLGK